MSDVDQPESDGQNIDTEAQMFVASEAREYALGNLSHQLDHEHIRQHAGIVQDDEVEQVLNLASDAYDPLTGEMPASFYETEFAQKILRNHGTKLVRKAIETGNFAYLDYLTGLTNYDPDISGIQTLMWLSDWISRTASINYVGGHMGNGKTDFGFLLAQIWLFSLTVVGDKNEREVSILTNVESAAEKNQNIEAVTEQEKLEARVKEDDDEYVIMIWDEASSHASGYAGDAHYVEQQLRRMLRMIRKNNGYLVIIGHTGKDVHPDVRRLSNYVHKTSKKTATIYEEVEGGEGDDKLKDLTGIPPTDFDFDTEEESDWEWREDEGEDSDDDGESTFDQCQFVKDNGEQCGTVHGLDEYGYCEYHRGSEQSKDAREQEDAIVESALRDDADEEGE